MALRGRLSTNPPGAAAARQPAIAGEFDDVAGRDTCAGLQHDAGAGRCPISRQVRPPLTSRILGCWLSTLVGRWACRASGRHAGTGSHPALSVQPQASLMRTWEGTRSASSVSQQRARAQRPRRLGPPGRRRPPIVSRIIEVIFGWGDRATPKRRISQRRGGSIAHHHHASAGVGRSGRSRERHVKHRARDQLAVSAWANSQPQELSREHVQMAHTLGKPVVPDV